MKNFHVILVSHGSMAEATLDTSKMIIGEVEYLSAVGLLPSEGPEDFKQKLREKIEKCPIKKVVIIADIMGGTPFNTAFRLASEGLCEALIPCLSLPLVIQLETAYVDAEDLTFLPEALEETMQSMKNVVDHQQNTMDEEDE